MLHLATAMGKTVLLFVLCFHVLCFSNCSFVYSQLANCNPPFNNMECANLGNISYPFWSSPSCAASPSYVLSNCSSSTQYASWDSFSAAQNGSLRPPLVVSVFDDLGFPTTIGINSPALLWNYIGYSTRIRLTWDTSFLRMKVCAALFPSDSLSHYNLPASINLTAFADSSFQFDSSNIYLLFNCTSKTNYSTTDPGARLFYEETLMLMQEESAECTAYKRLCDSLPQTSCIAVKPLQDLVLQDAMDKLSCSHFTFGSITLTDDELAILQWETGVVQLIWTDKNCAHCVLAARGVCVYDMHLAPRKLSYCECGSKKIRDFNVPYSCQAHTVRYDGLMQRHPILKIFTWTALTILGPTLVLAAVYYCRGNIRKGFLVFSMRLASIAINVLKKTLKQLQAFSYRPSHSFKDMDMEGLTERPLEYSYSSIASATKSFSNVVGEGGFGVVYKGTLRAADPQRAGSQGAAGSGNVVTEIAVKALERRSRHSKKQFLNEVVTIGRIHHLNVVRLLGFCMQEDHEMLVYEYVANGSLDRWLFERSCRNEVEGEQQKRIVLDWGQRYAIAVGVAKGLSYLHEECRHRTVHCDIKPQNILLDEEMCPKIADFGLARLMGREESQVVTVAKGTPGYMAPEFWMGGDSRLSTKFDVYSYGMVLLELMSGRRNFTASGRCFPAVAFEAIMQGDFETVLDDRLQLQGIMINTNNTSTDDDPLQQRTSQQIRTAALVALWCIQDQPARRPYMSEVVQYLEGVAAVPQDPPQPTISTSSTIISNIPPAPTQDLSSSHRIDFTPITSIVGR